MCLHSGCELGNSWRYKTRWYRFKRRVEDNGIIFPVLVLLAIAILVLLPFLLSG